MPDNTKPSAQEISDLKRLAAGIIRTQGNVFIKELLRSKGLPLGTNKDDFERNVTAAIEAGDLRLADVDEWLKRVEGWGDQHIYLYRLTPTITKDLTEAKVKAAAQQEGYGTLWNASTVLAFPTDPELTSISWSGQTLSLVWQEASPAWTPAPGKNYIEVEGLDTYEFRAYRLIEHRAITRFEVRKDLGLAALFIADPIQGSEHAKAVAEAKVVIGSLMNLPLLEKNQFDISIVSRNMDQQNVPTNANPRPKIRTQKTRLTSGSAYVEFAANSIDDGYAGAGPIRDVRKSIKSAQLGLFQGTAGVFWFEPDVGASPLAKARRLELHGKGDRLRLRAQMVADEVWTILTEVAKYREAV